MFELVVERGECLVFLLIYKFLNGVFFMTANALTDLGKWRLGVYRLGL